MPLVHQPAEVSEELDRILPLIRTKLAESSEPVVVSICGGTSTGKTTVVTELIKSEFPGQFTLIAQDHFQFLKKSGDQLDPRYGLDHPEHYGIGECVRLIGELKKGNSMQMPEFDFKTRTHLEPQTIRSNSILIVEGLYAGTEELRAIADVVIYIQSCSYERMIRRLFRNQYERYSGLLIDGNRSIHSYLTKVISAHNDFLVSQAHQADFVIDNPIRFGFLVDKHHISELNPSLHPQLTIWQKEFLDTQCCFLIETLNYQKIFSICWAEVRYWQSPIDHATSSLITNHNWLSK
ncbi:MAG: hypothetical protein MI748_03175 [Opitutales bacterium]|nr:hypothetical protein [Opitutales bacterium]